MKSRVESEFPWFWVSDDYSTSLKYPKLLLALLNKAKITLGLNHSRSSLSFEWLNNNSQALWESRSMLSDDLSKLLFDETLVLRLTGHRQFYFPRIDFDDLLEIVEENPFNNSDLPNDYVGLPLKIFKIQWRDHGDVMPFKIMTYKTNLTLLNDFRQYFIRRESIDFFPKPGDIVLDCGACIADTSMLFASLVSKHGEVHLFDPIPLHIRYCHLQASLNPSLSHVFHINELAVSNKTDIKSGTISNTEKISPGGLSINSFASTRLDDYAISRKLSRINYIKMDIEGAELDAIEGAENIVREFKPRLAISAYHKPNDLWEIPIKLKSLNPSYKLSFGHHTPVSWESVFYGY